MVNLQPHNIKAYREAKELLNKYNRAAIVQATGTGKSYVIMQLLQDYNDVEKLLVAPSVDILMQFKENEYWTGHKIKLITYQKLALMFKNGEINREEFGDLKLIITDELHRAGAYSWEKALKELMSLYKDVKLLGATATPVRFLDNNRDMVEELFDGHYASNLSVTEAILLGILPMPTYITSLYSLAEEVKNRVQKAQKYREYNGDKITSRLIDKLNNIKIEWEKAYGVERILQNHTGEILQRNKGLKVIVFCTDINRAEAFKPEIYNWFKKAFVDRGVNIYSYHTKAANYNKQFQKFKNAPMDGSINVLITVDKLNEGVHLNDVSAIIMLRKTMSNVVYYQQIGRVLSVGNQEKPIIIDLVNNCYEVGSSFAFWGEIVNDIKTKKREYEDKSKNVSIEVYDLIKPVLNLFDEIDRLLSTPLEVKMEAIRRAVKNGEDINNLSDKKLQMFVRKMLSYVRSDKIKERYKYCEPYVNELKRMGAIEYMNEPWSAEEDKILAENYGKVSRQGLSELLPKRSLKSISERLNKLGITNQIRWTEKEDNILLKYYPIEGAKVFKRLPGRTGSSISARANKLGIKTEVAWTPEEDAIFRKYYPLEGVNVIKRLPKRSKNSVLQRAALLGIKAQSKAWTEQEDGILYKFYAEEGTEVRHRLKGRTANAVRARAGELGLHINKKEYWTPEEDAIIREYYPIEGGDVEKRIPGKCKRAIKDRAQRIGVKYINTSIWDKYEDNIIKQFYPYEGTKILSRLPNRTKESIKRRARLLGVSYIRGE